jgi:thioredoxin-dependent peroxiredoxin
VLGAGVTPAQGGAEPTVGSALNQGFLSPLPRSPTPLISDSSSNFIFNFIIKENSLMAEERKGAVTMRGNPMTLVGPEIKVGQKAPNFNVVGKGMAPATLDQFKGKVKIITTVPSLDTPVCDAETRRFNLEASNLPGDVQILSVSMDLPFAQARWCGAAGVDKITTLSDWRSASFGTNYGALIKELHLLARAVFVVDKNDNVTYVEYVKEVAEQPNYEAVLAAAKKAAA